MAQIITLHKFYNPVEAEFFKARLESEGIQAFILDQNTNYTIGHTNLTGLRLQVKQDDLIKAKMILEKYLENQQ